MFTINKNNAIKTYLNILEYINDPDTFKCGLCLENFSYSTTIDYCCMKNYCQDCMRLQIINKKECAICHFPITKYPKKKDIIYSAGSMKVDRPLIKYDFANNTDRFTHQGIGFPLLEAENTVDNNEDQLVNITIDDDEEDE